MDLKCRY